MMTAFPKLLFAFLLSLSFPIHGEDPFHVYAPSRETGNLLVVEAHSSNGKLSLTHSQKIELGFLGSSIVAHPENPLLYIAPVRPEGDESGEPGAVVTLGGNGRYLKHQTIKLNRPAAYLSLDPESRFLLGVHYFGGQVDVYPLDDKGIPSAAVFSLDEERPFAHCILPTPDNRFVYIPYVKENNALYQYRFDANTGKLSPLDPKNVNPPEGTGPRHMAYHPEKPIVYFSNEQHLGVSVYEQQESGALKLLQVCDAVKPDEPKDGVSSSDIVITPDGRFLFAGIRGHKRDFDWISRYRILESGEVELLGLTPADKIPWGLALSPAGEYLIVSAFEGGTLTAFRIGNGGELNKAASLECDKQISDLVTRPIAR